MQLCWLAVARLDQLKQPQIITLQFADLLRNYDFFGRAVYVVVIHSQLIYQTFFIRMYFFSMTVTFPSGVWSGGRSLSSRFTVYRSRTRQRASTDSCPIKHNSKQNHFGCVFDVLEEKPENEDSVGRTARPPWPQGMTFLKRHWGQREGAMTVMAVVRGRRGNSCLGRNLKKGFPKRKPKGINDSEKLCKNQSKCVL